MKNISTLILFLAIALSGFAQAPDTAEDPKTFQYVFRSRDAEEAITLTSEQLTKLEQYRHSDKEVFVRVSEKTLIKLLPTNVITAPGFPASPIEEKLYFVELDMNLYYDIYKQAINLE